jgi:hypothetical protein
MALPVSCTTPSLQPSSGKPIEKADANETKQDKFCCNAVAFADDYPGFS